MYTIYTSLTKFRNYMFTYFWVWILIIYICITMCQGENTIILTFDIDDQNQHLCWHLNALMMHIWVEIFWERQGIQFIQKVHSKNYLILDKIAFNMISQQWIRHSLDIRGIRRDRFHCFTSKPVMPFRHHRVSRFNSWHWRDKQTKSRASQCLWSLRIFGVRRGGFWRLEYVRQQV